MPTSRSILVYVRVLAAVCACGHRDGTARGRQPSPRSPSAPRGASLFALDCASCHGSAGIGGRIGPSLRNERKRTSATAIRTAISDPVPPMPKLYPAELRAQDVDDLTAYVESL